MNKRYIATYGSLRLNEYNYNSFVNYFGIKNFKHIKRTKIDGYTLYDLGSYPSIVKTDTKVNPLVVDLFEVSSQVYDHIYEMEIGAGYKEVDIEIDNQIYQLYIMEEVPKYHNGIVSSGDWIMRDDYPKYNDNELEKELEEDE